MSGNEKVARDAPTGRVHSNACDRCGGTPAFAIDDEPRLCKRCADRGETLALAADIAANRVRMAITKVLALLPTAETEEEMAARDASAKVLVTVADVNALVYDREVLKLIVATRPVSNTGGFE